MLRNLERFVVRNLNCARFSSSLASEENKLKSNDSISPVVHNRNPRNLEKLRIARKPKGYALDAPFREYWHKLVITPTNRHLAAHVEHHSGKIVISASTNEWSIRQHLISTLDKVAAETVGRVLAQRCLECGLLEIHSEYKASETKSDKIKLLLKALEDAGVALTEPPCYIPHASFRKEAMEKPWEVVEDKV